MNKNDLTRRQFLSTASVGAIAAAASAQIPAYGNPSNKTRKLAILGGQPVRTKRFPRWPIWDKTEEKSILAALNSGRWGRAGVEMVSEVEKRFAELMGSKYCLLVHCGTHALHTSTHVLGIGGGDEVLVTPYTFVATIDVILLEDALPVFVDIDPETFQMDPDKIEEKITENTRAIMPVHITGGVCNMDKINSIARKYNLKVIEDACQAVLAEWRNKKAGTHGDLGCISFQSSKPLTCGEGGAILGDDEEIMDRCYSFHNFGRPKSKFMIRDRGSFPILATKYRVTSFQAAVLNAQMNHLERQFERRAENADYLTSRLNEILGINPRKDYEGTTKPTYYAYAFRYKKEHFNNLQRKKFLSALRAEGIPCSSGLGTIGSTSTPMNKEGLIEDALNSKSFQKIYSKERLNRYREQNHCPESDQLCKEIAGFGQNLLLGTKSDMDDIANAILKIYENRDILAKPQTS
ncbi:MAG: DegT/DnrJ/EryC1/StrS family aminotransferase [Planctomycetota bacterium]|jgi:dTDP-4-amino-4,6-dideoxygalactose transaminase